MVARMAFSARRVRVKLPCTDSSSGPTPAPPRAEDRAEHELTMCQIYSDLCAEHSCDAAVPCYGPYSCEGENSGCYATSQVPVYVAEDGSTVTLVRARDLPLLRLGLDAQLPHEPDQGS